MSAMQLELQAIPEAKIVKKPKKRTRRPLSTRFARQHVMQLVLQLVGTPLLVVRLLPQILHNCRRLSLYKSLLLVFVFYVLKWSTIFAFRFRYAFYP